MDHIEYELRKLDIDIQAFKQKLLSAGALHQANRQYRRHVFDVIPKSDLSWVRLRTDGETTTLCVKQIRANTVDGTHEWETRVEGFDETVIVLEKMGLISRSYQENRRSEYLLGPVTVCLDEWPLIPPYAEFEASSEEQILECITKLGLEKSQLTALNNQDIYKSYGIDITKRAVIKF